MVGKGLISDHQDDRSLKTTDHRDAANGGSLQTQMTGKKTRFHVLDL